MFHVGQMVVCVDDYVHPRYVVFGEVLPVKGMVYTIRSFDRVDEELCLMLEEIVNAPRHYRQGFGECSFRPHRFRPVRQTSIEQFTSILNQAPQREDA